MTKISTIKILTVFLFLGFISGNAFAQRYMDVLSPDQKENFFEIKKSFEKQWDGKDFKKHKGWKQYKRWEYFWRSRVMPDGSFPDQSILWNEMQKHRPITKTGKTGDKKLSTTWSSLGPQSSAGGYAGLGRLNCVKEMPGSYTTLWAGAASGGLWKTTDGGSTWSTNTDQLASIGISDIVIENAYPYTTMFIATGDRDAGDTYSVGVLKTTDGGSTWNTTGYSWGTYQHGRIGRLLQNPDNNQILIAASNGGIIRTTNGGTSWTTEQSGIFLDMEFKPDDPDIVYASGLGFYKSNNGGDSWQPINVGLPVNDIGRIAIAVAPSAPDIVYALISKSSDGGLLGVYKSTDAGESFTEVKDDGEPNLLGWYGDGTGDGGQGSYDLCITVSPSNANTIFVGGINVWKSTNGGNQWTPIAIWTGYSLYNPDPPGFPVVHADHHDLYFIPGSTRLFSSNDGGLYVTTDQGVSWSYIGSGIKNTQFYKLGITEDDAGKIIGGCQDNGTKVLSGGTWTDVLGGDGMECMIDHGNPNIMYGSLYYGDFRKSTDGGANFYEKMSGITEQGAWVTPYAMDPSDAETIWAGYRNIYKTTNGANSWSKMTNFSSSNKFDIIKISKSNTDIVIAAYTNGTTNTVKKTTNGGSSWGTISVPGGYLKDLEIDHANSDNLFISYGSYTASNKVQYSTNFGSSWNNITGNLPNVPINCIIKEEGSSTDRIWVGTDIGIWYCDDYDGDWQEYNDGLPNVVINEIAINYTASKLVAATYGRGIWQADKPTTATAAPAVLTSPVDDSLALPTDELKLNWELIATATSYQLQVSTNADMSSPLVDETGLVVLEHTLNGLANNTVYYWRVRGEGGGSFEWSDAWSFTTIVGAPTLSSPADESMAVPVRGELNWEALPGAETYKLQVAYNDLFTPDVMIIEEDGLSGSSYDYSSAGLTYNTYYAWRIIGTMDGKYGEPSDAWTFTTQIEPATLTYPTDNSINRPVSDTLKWDFASTAYAYRVDIATDEEFTNIVVTQDTILDLFYPYSGLSHNTLYYWRVQSFTLDGVGDKSEVWKFSTKLAPPTLTTPANAETGVPIQGDLVWETVSGADSYTVMLSTTEDFSDDILLDMADITDTDYPYGPLEFLTTYYWKVKAVASESESEWSEVSNFTTILGPPALLSPADEAIDQAIDGNLVFDAVTNADSYNIQLSEKDDFSSDLALDINTSSETTHAYSGLKINTTYYWRASSNDAGGNTSPWSEVWSFTTEAENGVVALSEPLNNATDVSLTPRLKWNALDNADSYEFELATANTFSGAEVIATDNGIADLFANIASPLNYETEYFWRVRAVIGGNNTDWSAVWSFTTIAETIELTAPTLLSPANNSTDIARTGKLKWQAVTDAEKYEIQTATDLAFNSVKDNDADIAAIEFSYTNYDEEAKYYWRARAIAGTTTGPWSDIWNFTTEAGPALPEKVVLISPVNNTDMVLPMDEMTWEAAAEADSYTLELSLVEDFSTIFQTNDNITDTKHEINGLNEGGVYYWRVKAIYGSKSTGWSDVWRFIAYSDLDSPVLLSPENLANKVNKTGEFAWESVDGADSYWLQLSRNDDFTAKTGAGSAMIYDAMNISSAAYSFDNLEQDSTYFWRVNQTSNDVTSRWSETWTFTVNFSQGIEDGPFANQIVLQVYPNPFSSSTTINFYLPSQEDVNLTIYNPLGTKIAKLKDGVMSEGLHSVVWDSKDLSNGLYLAKLSIGGRTYTLKLALEK